jgi:hypothetical protein
MESTIKLMIFLFTTMTVFDKTISTTSTATTEVPSTTFNNITNVTNDATTPAAEMTKLTSAYSTSSSSENQLKLSTTASQDNLITSTSSSAEAAVAASEVTFSTQLTPELNSNDEVETSSDAISFGIRSFTVEVSSKTEKVSTFAPITNAVATVATTASSSEKPTADPATTTSAHFNMDNVLKSNLNILFNDEDSETTALNEMKFSHENEISNEIQIDKKLDNGLYRIKIGEITTDEFNSGLNYNEREEDEREQRRQKDKLQHETKVNIDDFFPSKIEDFRPIIEISNEKMLKEKDVLHNEEVRVPEFALTESAGEGGEEGKSGTRINTSNVATTDIEIVLIDDTTAGGNGQSEIVSRVEEIVTEMSMEAPRAARDDIFIPRRSKKFDPMTKSNTQGPTRLHDFGVTKFNQKKMNASQMQSGGKPEYSTTKFYNSKELYNEILHKGTRPSSLPPKATSKPANLIREKLLSTNKIPIEASHISKTSSVSPTSTSTTSTVPASTTILPTIITTEEQFTMPTSHPRVLSRLEEKLNLLDCDIQNLSADSTIWRGNETHELNLPITVSNFLFLTKAENLKKC